MENYAMSTPVVSAPPRGLQYRNANEANISAGRRGSDGDQDCRGLIKRMTSEKKKSKGPPSAHASSQVNALPAASPATSSNFSVLFPPGSMGLVLEPVSAGIGARVKGYHFDDSYDGLSPVVVKDQVKPGDIISLVDDEDVSKMKYWTVFNVLTMKKSSKKMVTFQKSRGSVSEHVMPGTISLDAESSSTTIIPEGAKEKKNLRPEQDIAVLKHHFPVRYDELSQILANVGTNLVASLEKGVVALGVPLEDKTVQVLEDDGRFVPRYSQQDMDAMESKMCILLQELSRTCILLGKSEDKIRVDETQKASVKGQIVLNDNAITKLHETNADLTSRIEKLLHDLASEQANGDAWMARAKAAEEESQKAWEKCYDTNISRDSVSDSNKELIEEYAERVAALQDELNTAQAGAEEALQLCATEQENMQSEIALIRREQSERRAETAAALELMSVEKIQLEKERDSLAIELEVLRDMSGTDKASLDVERARVKEAMTVQQGLHMTKLLEKEDILYKLQEDYATLMDELVLVQKVNARLKDDISQAEAAREISLRELSEVKELKMELEAHNADLRSRNSDLEGMNSLKETELNRLRSANTELAVVKTESENYQKSYEAEQVQNRKLDDQLQSLRSQLAAAHRVSISSDTELTTLKREYDQLKMSSETAARLATEHINRVRRRYEDRERELLDALTIADNDVVTAKRETGRQKDGFVKEVAVLNATIGELELKVEDAKDAYATLSKSKYASEAIASQQTSHLQAEVSRLVNIETELQKVQEEHNAIVENLDRKCSVLSAEKNGMHMTLSKQLNKQLVNLKEEMSVMSQTLEAKDFALEKMSARLHDMDVLNKQLENDVRLKTRDLTECEEKFEEQQRLYDDLKDKMVMDFDIKVNLMKLGMEKDTEEKITFLKMAAGEKSNEESKLKAMLTKRENELLDVRSRYDLLDSSSKSAARVAAEQIERLRLRAEERERELLEIMKDGCKDSSSDDVDNASSSSGLVQSLQLKIQCLTQELSEAHRLHKIESTKLGQDLTHSTHVYSCVETELVNCRKLLEAEMMKRSDLEKKILELQNNFSIASDQHESELATVKNNDSDAMFILEEQNASLKCQLQDEQERIASSEEELRGKCEELCQQNKSMSMKQDALLANIDTLSQQVSTLKSKERELQELIHQQELSASEGVAEIESRYAEQVAEHVHEQERLKLLLVESTSNFTSLSEKYSFILSTRSETETKSEELYKQKYTDVSEECSRLKRDFSDLKQIQLDASQDFASTVQKFSQAIEKLKVGHRSHVDLLETKCTDLIETLKHQQQLIESANQQQKDSTHNRAAMMSIVEDWRRKTSEAMHTILHMQHAETAMKDAFRQEKATSNQLQEALQAKDSEITHLWELVVTLSKEVEQTTHTSEHLAKSIESWNSSHDFDSQLHVDVIPEVKSEDEDASPDSSDSSTLVKYAAIAKMFPSSPENRSNKYEHLNIPKILVDGLNSSCGVGVKLEDGDRGSNGNIPSDSVTMTTSTHDEVVVPRYEVNESTAAHHIFSMHTRSNVEDKDDVRMSADDEEEEDEYTRSSCCDFDDRREDEDVSGHVIGMHDFRLDDTAYWCLSSDTEEE